MTAKKKPAKRPTSTKSRAKKIKEEKVERNVPAKIGGEHETFTTLKKKAAMLTALKHSMGIVAPACEMIGIARSTYYHWFKTDEGFKEEVEAILEATFDFVEKKMLQRIQEGSDTMLIWYSKTKMKARGFVERSEIEVTEKPSFVVSEKQKGVNKVMDVIHKKTGTDNK